MDKNVTLSASENIWVSSSLGEIYTNTTTPQEKDCVDIENSESSPGLQGNQTPYFFPNELYSQDRKTLNGLKVPRILLNAYSPSSKAV